MKKLFFYFLCLSFCLFAGCDDTEDLQREPGFKRSYDKTCNNVPIMTTTSTSKHCYNHLQFYYIIVDNHKYLVMELPSSIMEVGRSCGITHSPDCWCFNSK